MKPRTKLHHQVLALKDKLPAITSEHTDWAYKKLFKFYAWKTKHKAACFECGHEWQVETNLIAKLFGVECPHCRKTLEVAETRSWSKEEYDAFQIMTTCGGFQVIRMFEIFHYCKKGYKAHYSCNEVYQHWISEQGKHVILAIGVNAMGGWVSGRTCWCWHTPMEIRGENSRYYINGVACYPGSKFIPIIKRNGFKGSFHKFNPAFFFQTLILSPKFETLLKVNQISLMAESTDRYQNHVDKYWAQVKICMRHNYIVKDAISWFDHIKLLEYFKMDIHNPKYICPEDFAKEHAELSKRKADIERRQARIEEEKREFENKLFRETKKKLLNLQFSDGIIVIVALKGINDFKKEQKIMEHCVYSSNYHKKDTSIILSARKNDKRLETIEVSLNDFSIRQCRGHLNEDSKYHKQILQLMHDSLPKLKSSFMKYRNEVKARKTRKLVVAA
jgi:hypothetical protein